MILAKQSDKWYVASAAHGFQGTIGGVSKGYLYDETQVSLTLRMYDKSKDYVLLELPDGNYVGAESWDGSDMKVGEAAIIAGRQPGIPKSKYYNTTIEPSRDNQIVTRTTVVNGFSGGGLFVRNKLVAITLADKWGGINGEGRSYFCPITAVHEGYHRLGHVISVGLGWCPRCPKHCNPRVQTPIVDPPMSGKPGPSGKDGANGRDGKDGKDADEQAILLAIFEKIKNDPNFRGRDGKDGAPGQPGQRGSTGSQGPPGDSGDLTELIAKIKELESREIALEIYQGGKLVGVTKGKKILRLDLQDVENTITRK